MATDISDIIRIGQVSSVDPENGTCRVAFDDMMDGDGNPFVSGPLMVMYQRTVNRQDFSLPEIGEHVRVTFLPNGETVGFVDGSYYTAGNLPKEGATGIYRTRYADGTIIEYDLNTNTALVKSNYAVVVDCKTANVKADVITIEGNVNITGDVTVNGDVVAVGISLKTHTHGGVQVGGGSTGGPQ